MNLFKRMTALMLAGVMTLGLLSGCGRQGGQSASGSQSGAVSGSVEEEPLGTVDLATVTDICTYLCGLPADTVVATAAGEDLTAGEVMYWMVTNCDTMVEYYYYYQGTDQLPWTTVVDEGEGGKTFAYYMVQDSVNYAAVQRIVENKAAEAGLTVKEEDTQAIQASLDSLTEHLAAGDGKITAEQYLWQQALTNQLYTWNCEMDYLYQGLTDYYFGPGGEREPTEEVLEAYLDANGYYSVKHILLETKESTEEEKAQKKAKAQELLAQIEASGNDEAVFDKLMKEHSEDPGLATNPEGYTFQTNTNVDPAFEGAALILEPGQLSGVVEGMHGYHILLRLPLKATEEHKKTFIDEQMSLMGSLWLDAAEVKLTEAGEKLDAKAVYEAMQIYRNTIAQLTKE